jgi:hypothetical protein
MTDKNVAVHRILTAMDGLAIINVDGFIDLKIASGDNTCDNEQQ